jgi:uncharacterized membrane protein
MTLADRFSLFDPLDVIAVLSLLTAWLIIGWLIEHPPARRPSVGLIMADYRREWMRQMAGRDPLIFDSNVLGNLRQGTAFLASATMIAIGGGLALLGDTETLTGIAEELTQTRAPLFVWDVKIALVLILVANAFLKFVWAHRLFGYCSVLVAAVPNDVSDPLAQFRASQAAEINVFAARSFNRGLWSVYFALAATAWLAGAVPLLVAVAITLFVLWRREFASHSRAILLRTPPHADVTTLTNVKD